MRYKTARAALFLLVLAALPPAADGQRPPDAVEELRLVLASYSRVGSREYLLRVGADKAIAEFEKQLKEAGTRVKAGGLDLLSRALLLQDWEVFPLSDEKVQARLNAALREQRSDTLKAFIGLASEKLKKGNVVQRVALCHLIRETMARPIDKLAETAVINDLGPLGTELVRLADPWSKPASPDEVRIAASRALTYFSNELPSATVVWRRMLAPTQSPGVRLAAAESVEEILSGGQGGGSRLLRASEPGVTPRDRQGKAFVITYDMASLLLPLALRGLTDPAVPVRRISAHALRQGADGLWTALEEETGRVPETFQADNKFESEYMIERLVRLRPLRSVFQTLATQRGSVRGALLDPDTEVRAETQRSLASLARLVAASQALDSKLIELRKSSSKFPTEADVNAYLKNLEGPQDKFRREEDRKGKEEPKKDLPDDRNTGAGRTARPGAPAIRLVGADDKDGDAPGPAAGPSFLPGTQALQRALLEAADVASNRSLTDPDPIARRAAATAVESLGKLAAPLAPRLVKMLRDEDMFVRWIAARTLGNLAKEKVDASPTTAVPGLIAALGDEDQDTRMAVITALGRYGSAAKEAVPPLTKLLTRGDAEVRVSVLRALDEMSDSIAPALPTVASLFDNPDPRVRTEAATLIGRSGEAGRPYLGGLRKLIEDRDRAVRSAASSAVLAIDR